MPLCARATEDMVVRKVNEQYNVDGLCRELPSRVDALYDAEGGKLAK